VARAVAGWLGTSTLGPQLLQVVGGIAAGMGAFLGIAMALRLPELKLIRVSLSSWMGRR
jgi:hypothetical protein